MAGHRPSSRAATARWLLAAVLLGLCTGLATLDLVAVLTLRALGWWCTRLDWWQRCATVMFSALALASFDPGVLASAELTQAVGAAALVLGALTWTRARSARPLGPQTRWFLLTHRWHSAADLAADLAVPWVVLGATFVLGLAVHLTWLLPTTSGGGFGLIRYHGLYSNADSLAMLAGIAYDAARAMRSPSGPASRGTQEHVMHTRHRCFDAKVP